MADEFIDILADDDGNHSEQTEELLHGSVISRVRGNSLLNAAPFADHIYSVGSDEDEDVALARVLSLSAHENRLSSTGAALNLSSSSPSSSVSSTSSLTPLPSPKLSKSTDQQKKVTMPSHNTRWSAEEDTLLVDGLTQHGYGKWSHISQVVKSRSAIQCKNRARHLKESGKLSPQLLESFTMDIISDGNNNIIQLGGVASPVSFQSDDRGAKEPSSPTPSPLLASDDSTLTELNEDDDDDDDVEVDIIDVEEDDVPVNSQASVPLPVSDISDSSDIDQENEKLALDRALELTKSPSLPPSPPAVTIPAPVRATSRDLPRDTITNDEIQSMPEWFPALTQETVHPRQIHSRIPSRYLAIRNMILDLWNGNASKYMTKTAARNVVLRKISCDVNAIGRVYEYLNANSFINIGKSRYKSGDAPKSKENRSNKIGGRELTEIVMPNLHRALFEGKRNRRVRDPETGEWMQESELHGRTISHVSNAGDDDEPITTRKRKRRTLLSIEPEDPFQLIPCSSLSHIKSVFDYTAPFRVTIAGQAMALIDLHARSFSTEIIGLIGGRMLQDTDGDEFSAVIAVESIYPCSTAHSSHIQCEMDPMTELAATDYFSSRGLRVVGWYHSHPNFDTSPSRRDIQTQALWQRLFRIQLCKAEHKWIHSEQAATSKESVNVEPFIGIILSPHNPDNVRPDVSDVQVLHLLPEEISSDTLQRAYTPSYQIQGLEDAGSDEEELPYGMDDDEETMMMELSKLILVHENADRDRSIDADSLKHSMTHWLSPSAPDSLASLTGYFNFLQKLIVSSTSA
eukprot:Partr_v1_DN28189_c1_g1_i1_m55494 putative 26S proteasome, non-ATPase regulatory subunit